MEQITVMGQSLQHVGMLVMFLVFVRIVMTLKSTAVLPPARNYSATVYSDYED